MFKEKIFNFLTLKYVFSVVILENTACERIELLVVLFCCLWWTSRTAFSCLSIAELIWLEPEPTFGSLLPPAFIFVWKTINVKGTVSQKNTPPGPHMNRQKRFCEIFRYCEDIRKNVCPRSQRLSWQAVKYFNLEKLMKKITKNVIWYFRKLCVRIQ